MATVRERYKRAEQMLPWNAARLVRGAPVVPEWLDSGAFVYRRRTADGIETVRVDVASGEKTLVDAAFSGAAAVLGTGESVSPDGRSEVFVRDHDVWLRTLASGEERALTSDGEPYWDYAGTPEGDGSAVSDRGRGIARPPVVRWSPDSRRLLTHRLDQRGVPDTPMVRHVPPDGVLPELLTYRQNRPGDPIVVTSQLLLIDVESGEVAEFEHPVQSATRESPLEKGRAWWSGDGRRVWFIHMGRGERSATLLEYDVANGRSRTVLTESTATTMDLHPTRGRPPLATILEASGEVLWYSERDGWGHLYLYDLAAGQLKRQLTRGAWVVRDVLATDQTSRIVHLLGGGREPERDPYYRHLYRVSLDGGDPELLTPEDADHEAHVSPDCAVFVDNAATVSEPPVARLRACDGRLIAVLEEADVSALDERRWRRPRRFTVKAQDGETDLYGTLFFPRDFVPFHVFPVVEHIGGGRQTTHAPVRMPAEQARPAELFEYWYPQAVAELGFVVMTFDGLGTPYRSRAMHDVSYGTSNEVAGLDDHVGALRQLAERHRFVDVERIGIFGHAGGGSAAARALFVHPETYKVGIASCGTYDMRLYDRDSCEKDLALFAGENDGSTVDVTALAGGLEGELFLVCGELDRTSHPAMTMRLVDALIKAGKTFDLLVMPGADHDLQSDTYFLRRSWDFLVGHLLGEETA